MPDEADLLLDSVLEKYGAKDDEDSLLDSVIASHRPVHPALVKQRDEMRAKSEAALGAEDVFVDRSGEWDVARESLRQPRGEYEPQTLFAGSPVRFREEPRPIPEAEEAIPFSQRDTPLNVKHQRDQEVRAYVEDHVPKGALDDLAYAVGVDPKGAEHHHFLVESGTPLTEDAVRRLSDVMILDRVRKETEERRKAAEEWRKGPLGTKKPWFMAPPDPKTPKEARELEEAFRREAEENIWTGRATSVGSRLAGVVAGPVNLIPNIFGKEGIGDPEKEMVNGSPALRRTTELAGQEMGTQIVGSSARLAGEVALAAAPAGALRRMGVSPHTAGAVGFGVAGALSTSGSLAERLWTGAEFTAFGLVAPAAKAKFSEALRRVPRWLREVAAGELAFLITSAGMSGATLKPMTLEELKQNAVLGLVFEASGGYRRLRGRKGAGYEVEELQDPVSSGINESLRRWLGTLSDAERNMAMAQMARGKVGGLPWHEAAAMLDLPKGSRALRSLTRRVALHGETPAPEQVAPPEAAPAAEPAKSDPFAESARRIDRWDAERADYIKTHGERSAAFKATLSGADHVVVGPDPSKPGRFRVTWFDKVTGEASGHTEHATFDEALRDAQRDWGAEITKPIAMARGGAPAATEPEVLRRLNDKWYPSHWSEGPTPKGPELPRIYKQEPMRTRGIDLDQLRNVADVAGARDHMKLAEQAAEKRILGDRYEEWAQAQRRVNSSNEKVSREAEDTIREIEAGLSEADRDALYGVGEKGVSSEQLHDLYLRAQGSIGRPGEEAEVGRSIGRAMRDYGGDKDVQGRALLRIMYNEAKRNGLDMGKVEQAARSYLEEYAKSTGDAGDAAFLFRDIMGRLGVKETSNAVRQREAEGVGVQAQARLGEGVGAQVRDQGAAQGPPQEGVAQEAAPAGPRVAPITEPQTRVQAEAQVKSGGLVSWLEAQVRPDGSIWNGTDMVREIAAKRTTREVVEALDWAINHKSPWVQRFLASEMASVLRKRGLTPERIGGETHEDRVVRLVSEGEKPTYSKPEVVVERPRRRKMVPDEGKDSLATYIRKSGGLKYGPDVPESGELKAYEGRSILRTKGGGLSVDQAFELARNFGYLPKDATINDFWEALDADLHGNRVYSRSKEGYTEAYIREEREYFRQMEAELGEPPRSERTETTEDKGYPADWDLPESGPGEMVGGLSMMPGVMAAGRAAVRGAPALERAAGKIGGSWLGELRRSGPMGARAARALEGVEKVFSQRIYPAMRGVWIKWRTVASKKDAGIVIREMSKPKYEPGEVGARSDAEMKYQGERAASPEEQAVLDSYRDVMLKRGELAEKAGVPGFRNRPDVLPRVSAADRFRILSEGTKGDGWEPYIRAKTERNLKDALDRLRAGQPLEYGYKQQSKAAQEVTQEFKSGRIKTWQELEAAVKRADARNRRKVRGIDGTKETLEEQETLRTEGPMGLDRKSQFEFKRRSKHEPAWIKVKGRDVQLLETDLWRHGNAVMERGSRRIAFGRVFGWPKKGGNAPRALSQLRQKYIQEGGDPELFDRAVHGIQGGSMTEKADIDWSPSTLHPVKGGIRSTLAALSGGLKSLVLGRAWKAAATESFGPLVEIVGPRQAFKHTVKAVFESLAERLGGRPESAQVARLREHRVMEEARTPKRWRSLNRGAVDAIDRFAEGALEAELLGPVSRTMNQRNYATALDQWMDGLRNGLSGVREKMAAGYLRIYGGLDWATSHRLASGQGSPAEYLDATRRIVSNMSGTGVSPLERSRIESAWWFRKIPFTRYATTQMRTEARFIRDLLQSAATSKSEFGLAMVRMGKHMFGRTMQSVTWQLLGHILAGGSFEQFRKRWEDNPGGELAVALSTAVFAGSYGNMAYSFLSENLAGGDLASQAGSTIMNSMWPAVIATDVFQAVTGSGRYEGRDEWDRMWTALRRWAPITNDVIAYAAILGIAPQSTQKQNELYQARREFSRFRYGPAPRGYVPAMRESQRKQTTEEEERDEAFRLSMLKVGRMVQSFEDRQDIYMEIQNAVRAKGAESVARSLYARRMMRTGTGEKADPFGKLSREERRTIRGALTRDTIKTIMRYDIQLDALASWVMQTYGGGGSSRGSPWPTIR